MKNISESEDNTSRKHWLSWLFAFVALIFFWIGMFKIDNSTALWANYLMGAFFIFFAFLNRFKRIRSKS